MTLWQRGASCKDQEAHHIITASFKSKGKDTPLHSESEVVQDAPPKAGKTATFVRGRSMRLIRTQIGNPPLDRRGIKFSLLKLFATMQIESDIALRPQSRKARDHRQQKNADPDTLQTKTKSLRLYFPKTLPLEVSASVIP
ncbi:hypothetical protein FNV43_RR11237 [Rhamnella rubrinervis]|uniref:Uncharacterized protein n=1 Tax=Rhamnella rubrinervis TaxID=2594499 RepID=A0A8K0H5L7_9ROSA|nr:hypothetical protein FNV43_RR11237 [Rhamnella rubrinervis]